MSLRIYPEVQIVSMSGDQWPRLREIYLEGIASGFATFETTAPSWEEWDAAHHPFARLAAMRDGLIIGWAALSPVSKRQVYAGVAEVSVYVSADFHRRGCGRALLESLITKSEQHGIWTLQASIFPENVASLELHRSCGFRDVGIREQIAKLAEIWRSTLLLERRSKTVGMS